MASLEILALDTIVPQIRAPQAGDTYNSPRPIVLSAGTFTALQPALDVSQTWNNAAVTFTGVKYNVTNTASNAASLLLDLQVGGASKFKVDTAGAVTSTNWNIGSAGSIAGVGWSFNQFGNGAVLGLTSTNSGFGTGGSIVGSTWAMFGGGATNASSLRINAGVAPTAPVNGDIWFDGTNIKMQIGGVTKTFTLT